MIVPINLRVRERPDLESDVVAWLPADTEITLLGRIGISVIWLNILTPNEQEGWVRESAVDAEEQGVKVADLPVVPTPTPPPTPSPSAVPPPPSSPPPQTPTGRIVLEAPTSAAEEFFADVEFKWHWEGDTLPPDYGFEVLIWREGEPMSGAHNPVTDNAPSGNIQHSGNQYSLTLNVTFAPGVRNREGVYLWTVRLIPLGAGTGQPLVEAEPGAFFFNQ